MMEGTYVGRGDKDDSLPDSEIHPAFEQAL